MFARIRSRVAGLVFVLAMVFGGLGSAASVDDGSAASVENAATKVGTLTIEWT